MSLSGSSTPADTAKGKNFPIFAVVGHPNQGKSSVVSTLVQDDHIAISPVSGTTRQTHHYQLMLAAEVLYELVDTPGFQRPRQLLEWCQARSTLAVERRQILAQFIAEHRHQPRFAGDCALLEPILDGAGIVYVVDPGQPFTAAFEAELTLLSWTGQPRLALLNPLQPASDNTAPHAAGWSTALQQYFSLVRTFNPLLAPFEQHLSLLRAMSEIYPAWQANLLHSATALQQQRQSRHQQAAEMIEQYLHSILRFHLKLPVVGARETIRSAGLAQYNGVLQQREAALQKKLATLYGHHHLDWHSEWQDLHRSDLTDRHEWRVWGLSRKRLASLSAGAGAMSGLMLDAASGGSSLFLGTLVGGTLGGLIGSFAGRDPLSFELVSKIPGYEQWQLGPVSSLAFATALVGRALRSWYQVRMRNHARRDQLMLGSQNLARWLEGLDRKQQVQLLSWLGKLLKRPLEDSEQHQLQALLQALGEQMEAATPS